MNQVFAHYEHWEDWAAGMYAALHSIPNPAAAVAASLDLFRSRHEFRAACRQVITAWPVASAVNLTDTTQNRRAWLGQASHCLELGIPAAATCQAWNQLTSTTKAAANKDAQTIITRYVQEARGAQTLFG